eukprot:2885225-Rhodomonas_salina.1
MVAVVPRGRGVDPRPRAREVWRRHPEPVQLRQEREHRWRVRGVWRHAPSDQNLAALREHLVGAPRLRCHTD